MSPEQLAEPASLLMPAGMYGPAFLILKNYYVIKDYNFSDLYVLFVGHLADRIAGNPPFAIGDVQFEFDVAMGRTQILRDGQIVFHDRRRKEFALLLDGQEPVGKQKSPSIAIVSDDPVNPRHLANQRALE